MSDPITIADFRARFPEFNDPVATDAQVEAAIEDTQCNFDIDKWGCHYKRGHSLYVAHYLTIQSSRSAGGSSGASPSLQATSKSVDGVSVSYNASAASSNSDEWFKSTGYGQEYLMLLGVVAVPAVLVSRGKVISSRCCHSG